MVLVLAAACSSDPPVFTPADLPRVVLQADDAPAGTRMVADASGERDLDAFARDGAERDGLEQDGFVLGYVVLFAPEAWFDPNVHVGSDAVSVQVVAGLFEAPEGAASSLRRYLGDLRDRQIESAEDLTVPDLGDEAYGLRGVAPADGSPLLVYLWRVRNLILVVSGSGPVDESLLAVLGATMSERALASGSRRAA